MSDVQNDKLLDHNYDGIAEYDNPLPFWWVGIFWLTIVFSVVYFIFFQFGPGPSIYDEHNQGMMELYDMQAKELLKLGPISDQTLLKIASDAGMMSGAKALFVSKCSPCHGASGEGNIGPNLTDDFWIHGGRPMQVLNTISEGVLAKGMLSWKNQLSPFQMMSLAAYVQTLHGSNPPNGKAPDGKKTDVAAEIAAAAAEAAKKTPAPAPATAPAPLTAK